MNVLKSKKVKQKKLKIGCSIIAFRLNQKKYLTTIAGTLSEWNSAYDEEAFKHLQDH